MRLRASEHAVGNILRQALDVTANRLSILEPNLLALSGVQCRPSYVCSANACSHQDMLLHPALYCGAPAEIRRGNLKCAGLQTLSLRQNLLEDAAAVAHLASAGQLTELILQDNRLTTVGAVLHHCSCHFVV